MSYEGTKTQLMSSETQIPLENLEPKFANNIDQGRLNSVQKNFVNSTRIMYKEIKRTLKFYNTYSRRSIERGDNFYGN